MTNVEYMTGLCAAAAMTITGPSFALAQPSSRTIVVSDRNDVARVAGWAALAEKVKSWSLLSHDWDGQDGLAISRIVASEALAFIADGQQRGAPVPSAYIGGDGEVGLTWRTAQGRATVSFLADGSLVASLRRYAGFAPLTIDKPFAQARAGWTNLFIRLQLLA